VSKKYLCIHGEESCKPIIQHFNNTYLVSERRVKNKNQLKKPGFSQGMQGAQVVTENSGRINQQQQQPPPIQSKEEQKVNVS